MNIKDRLWSARPKSWVAAGAILCLIPGASVAAGPEGTPLRFDPNILKSLGLEQAQVDDVVSQQAKPHGDQDIGIYINTKYAGIHMIHFDDDGKPCFNRDLLKTFMFNPVLFKLPPDSECADLGAAPQIEVRYDRQKLSLYISAPDYYFVKNAQYANLQSGGVGTFLNYNVSGSRSEAFGAGAGASDSFSALMTAGANIENYILRADFTSFTYRPSPGAGYSRHSLVNAYVETDIAEKYRARAGYIPVGNSLLGAGQIYGLALSDDVGMRVGDTTVDVNGTAAGYAQVQVLQQGRVVFSRPVPAGAFRFEAGPLHTAYADAEVVVREEGGSEQRFTIPRAAFAVSKNMASRFSMFAGKLDTTTGMSGGPVFGVQYSLPMREYVQPVVAAMVAHNYVIAGAGLTANLFADGARGDLGIIAARSGSRGDIGAKVNANLSTQIANTNPYLSLAWQGRQYRDLSQSRMQSLDSLDSFDVTPYYSAAAGVGGSLTRKIGAAFSVSRTAYYDQPSSNSLGLSATYNAERYTLSANINYGWTAGTASAYGNAWSAYLTLRIPFKLDGRSGTSTSYYRSYGNTTGIGQSVDQRVTDNLSMGAGAERSGQTGSASTRNFAQAFWRTPYTNASGYYSETQGSGRNFSASGSGSLVAADSKLVFSSERVQDTFAIIDSGVKGYVDVDTPTSRVTTNYDGLAVAPQLFEGGSNIISIVTKTLRDGAYVKNPRQEVTVTRGAVAQVRYESNDDRVYLIKLLSDKVLFPMGSKALSGNGELIGYMVDENILMASKENMQRIASGQARVVNTSGTSCAIVADEKFSASAKSDLVEVKVSCGEGHE